MKEKSIIGAVFGFIFSGMITVQIIPFITSMVTFADPEYLATKSLLMAAIATLGFIGSALALRDAKRGGMVLAFALALSYEISIGYLSIAAISYRFVAMGISLFFALVLGFVGMIACFVFRLPVSFGAASANTEVPAGESAKTVNVAASVFSFICGGIISASFIAFIVLVANGIGFTAMEEFGFYSISYIILLLLASIVFSFMGGAFARSSRKKGILFLGLAALIICALYTMISATVPFVGIAVKISFILEMIAVMCMFVLRSERKKKTTVVADEIKYQPIVREEDEKQTDNENKG